MWLGETSVALIVGRVAWGDFGCINCRACGRSVGCVIGDHLSSYDWQYCRLCGLGKLFLVCRLCDIREEKISPFSHSIHRGV